VITDISQVGVTHLVTFDDFEDAESDGAATWRTTGIDLVAFVGDTDWFSDSYFVVFEIV
jgi:hypothetical protein